MQLKFLFRRLHDFGKIFIIYLKKERICNRIYPLLISNITNITWQQVVMWIIGGVLIYLAIKKDMEPTLLLPMGFGAILVNLPLSGAVTQIYDG